VKNAFKWLALFAIPVLILTIVGAPAIAQTLSAPEHWHMMITGVTIGATNPTLWDVAKAFGPDGRVAAVAELLSQKNQMLEDIPWFEGNLPSGHRITQRVGLPTVYFRLLNQGVPKSKSLRAQVDEQTAMMEARSQVDVKLAEAQRRRERLPPLRGEAVPRGAEPEVRAHADLRELGHGSGAVHRLRDPLLAVDGDERQEHHPRAHGRRR
jgi:hypothetical protein